MFAKHIKTATITGVLICIANLAHALDCQIVSGSGIGLIAPEFQVFTNGKNPENDTFEILGLESKDWIFKATNFPMPQKGTTYPKCATDFYKKTGLDIVSADCFTKSQPTESKWDAGLKIQKLSDIYISFSRTGSSNYHGGKWSIKQTSVRLEIRNGEIVGVEGTYSSHAEYLCFE